MKGFIISLTMLIAITALTVTNAVFYQRTVDSISKAVDKALLAEDEEKSNQIEACLKLVGDSKIQLHLTLRRSRIDALRGTLGTAYAYSVQGNGDEADIRLKQAAEELKEWQGMERPGVWNIL